MPKIIIDRADHEITGFVELKAWFAKNAKYSENGKTVTVGQFIAHRKSPWNLLSPVVGFDCYDLERQKVGLSSSFFVPANSYELEKAFEILSEKQALMHLDIQLSCKPEITR